MHTLQSYQRQVAQTSGDITAKQASSNLLETSARLFCDVRDNRETGQFASDDREQVFATLGAALFNIALLCDRYGLSVQDVANTQLERLMRASESGKLRAQVGRL